MDGQNPNQNPVNQNPVPPAPVTPAPAAPVNPAAPTASAPASAAPSAPKESSVGPITGVIIILVVILIGGLYFWMKRTPAAPAAPEAPVVQDTATNNMMNQIKQTSPSDDTSAIMNDLTNTQVDSLDTNLNGTQ